MKPSARSARHGRIVLHDLEPGAAALGAEALAGLTASRKTLPCKLLYDEVGAWLFERICELDAYYLTRAETQILLHHGEEIARALGRRVRLVEPGSGSGAKTRILLRALEQPAAYVPVDISRVQLLEYSLAIADEHPDLEVLPVCADYTTGLVLPADVRTGTRTVVFFPGSTIGNFEPVEAEAFLRRLARLCGPDGGVLIGVDLKKERQRLEAAYDDPQGITAAFNLNLLRRLNRECGADFDLAAFSHRAIYDERRGRIEMHLVSLRAQEAHLPPASGEKPVRVAFQAGETIDTEHSYKYTVAEFAGLAARAGLVSEQVWLDRDGLFSLHWLRVRRDPSS